MDLLSVKICYKKKKVHPNLEIKINNKTEDFERLYTKKKRFQIISLF